jgi:membrane fusion protein, multidrug efflux system
MAVAANAGGHFEPRRSHPGRAKRVLLVVLGLLLVVGALAATKGAQIASLIKFGKRAQAAGPPPETVGTFVAENQTWSETLDSVGSVTTSRGVTISNDSPGIVSRLAFDSGATARPGQILAELDARVERAELAAATARKQLATTTAGRTRALTASGAIPQAQKDTDEAQLAAANAEEKSITAQIERKIVRAPFAGKLGIRLVNVGQYLPPGTPITLLESEESLYVDFALPQQNLDLLAVGMPVRLTVERGDTGSAAPQGEGKIFAVEPAVDPTTRSIKLRASLPPGKDGFKPGMFVNVSVVQPKQATVVAVPATAIVHASFGDSVFVVEDDKDPSDKPIKSARQQFVRLGQRRGDFIAITDGVQAGQEIVTAGAFKLRNQAPIVVNNEVQLRPELSSRPANR